ncbi:MAG: alpha/beta hydrolase [Pseudonocardia sp.]|nr:alpha/beta hydrolase [Pseudonocardia sp.]
MSTIDVNGTTLYYERRGDGPPVLFISGTGGDAGYFTTVADALADEYTTVTYDRRANSRSPRPAGWDAAPIAEQADDAAGLLRALDLAPAVGYGLSSGAMILTDLALRHPDVLTGAVLAEPPIVGASSTPEAVGAGAKALVDEGMAVGGPAAAMELFVRYADADEVFESLDPELQARVRGNGEVFFGLEMASVMSYHPGAEQLARVEVPCVVTAGVDHRDPGSNLHWFYESAQWLAAGLGTEVVETPGGHVPMWTHPQAFVEILRPILNKLS